MWLRGCSPDERPSPHSDSDNLVALEKPEFEARRVGKLEGVFERMAIDGALLGIGLRATLQRRRIRYFTRLVVDDNQLIAAIRAAERLACARIARE